MIATCVEFGDTCRNAGSGLEDENKAVGCKMKGEEETDRGEVLIHQENSSLPEESHEDWCEEVAEDGLGPCGSVEEEEESKLLVLRPQKF